MRTAYDNFADKVGIIDRATFLENIKLLCKYDESYKEKLEYIIELSNKADEIEQGLDFNTWKKRFINTYYIWDLQMIAVYNMLCKEKHAFEEYTSDELLVKCYEIYQNNNEYFNKTMAKSDSEILDWMVYPKSDISKPCDLRQNNLQQKEFVLPPVPEVPHESN